MHTCPSARDHGDHPRDLEQSVRLDIGRLRTHSEQQLVIYPVRQVQVQIFKTLQQNNRPVKSCTCSDRVSGWIDFYLGICNYLGTSGTYPCNLDSQFV